MKRNLLLLVSKRLRQRSSITKGNNTSLHSYSNIKYTNRNITLEQFYAHPNPNSFDGCLLISKQGNVDECFRIYEKVNKESSGMVSAQLIVALMMACKKFKQHERAKDLWEPLIKVLQLNQESLKAINEFNWNVILSGLFSNGFVGYGLEYLKLVMNEYHVKLTPITMNVILKSLVDHDMISEMMKVFESMKQSGDKPDFYHYNCIIKGLSKNGRLVDAMQVLYEMKNQNIKPDEGTFKMLLSNCNTFDVAMQLWNYLKTDPVLKESLTLYNMLLNVLVQLDKLEEALIVFHSMKSKSDVISYTIILNGFRKQNLGERSLTLFNNMIKQGIHPDAKCVTTMLDICCTNGMEKEMRILFHEIEKFGLKMEISYYNILLKSLLVKSDNINEAMVLLKHLQQYGPFPDSITFTLLAQSCAEMASIENSEYIYDSCCKEINADTQLLTTLVHMFGKCGKIEKAEEVFKTIKQKDSFTYSTMINAYGLHGKIEKALTLFEYMKEKKLPIDALTITSILNACSNNGNDVQAIEIFNNIQNYTNFKTILALLIKGKLEEAIRYIRQYPHFEDVTKWMSVLASARKFNNIRIGEFAFKELTRIDITNASAYVLMVNIYEANGMMKKEVKQLRQDMVNLKVSKIASKSFIEINGIVHQFTVEETRHSEMDAVYNQWNRLIEQITKLGYQPDTSLVTRDIQDEDERIDSISKHSEKLAICYGILKTPPNSPITITSNLRICKDCHTATKLISTVTGREIMIRDASRFHHFKDGKCSCNDYW